MQSGKLAGVEPDGYLSTAAVNATAASAFCCNTNSSSSDAGGPAPPHQARRGRTRTYTVAIQLSTDVTATGGTGRALDRAGEHLIVRREQLPASEPAEPL
jgi:hypothetical protein